MVLAYLAMHVGLMAGWAANGSGDWAAALGKGSLTNLMVRTIFSSL